MKIIRLMRELYITRHIWPKLNLIINQKFLQSLLDNNKNWIKIFQINLTKQLIMKSKINLMLNNLIPKILTDQCTTSIKVIKICF